MREQQPSAESQERHGHDARGPDPSGCLLRNGGVQLEHDSGQLHTGHLGIPYSVREQQRGTLSSLLAAASVSWPWALGCGVQLLTIAYKEKL